MSGPRQVGQYGLTAFVESTGADRKDTAIILIGTAREAGLDDALHVRSSLGGYYISDELADILYDEDETEVSGNGEEPEPETEQTPKKASGNRAAKNSTAEQE